MNNIFEIKTGLPDDKTLVTPILQQFNMSRLENNHNGTLIFDDGAIYISIIDKTDGNYSWKYFTHLKKEGIVLMHEAINNEFVNINSDVITKITSQNILIWKSFIDGKKKEVKVASGSYSNLPPVFQKIDNLINHYMFKMNERIEEK